MIVWRIRISGVGTNFYVYSSSKPTFMVQSSSGKIADMKTTPVPSLKDKSAFIRQLDWTKVTSVIYWETTEEELLEYWEAEQLWRKQRIQQLKKQDEEIKETSEDEHPDVTEEEVETDFAF